MSPAAPAAGDELLSAAAVVSGTGRQLPPRASEQNEKWGRQ